MRSSRWPRRGCVRHDSGMIPLAEITPIRPGTDTCPFACWVGADPVWMVDQEVPGSDASLEDDIVADPSQREECVLPQVVPDVTHAAQLRRLGREGQQRDVIGHAQLFNGQVPTGAFAQQHDMGAGRSLGADFGQVHLMAFASR